MNKLFNSARAYLLLSLSFALVSCSTEYKNNALSSNVSNSIVIKDLEAVNSGLLTHAPQPTTRGKATLATALYSSKYWETKLK